MRAIQFLSIFRLMRVTEKQVGCISVSQYQCWMECRGWEQSRAAARCGQLSHQSSQSHPTTNHKLEHNLESTLSKLYQKW